MDKSVVKLQKLLSIEKISKFKKSKAHGANFIDHIAGSGLEWR